MVKISSFSIMTGLDITGYKFYGLFSKSRAIFYMCKYWVGDVGKPVTFEPHFCKLYAHIAEKKACTFNYINCTFVLLLTLKKLISMIMWKIQEIFRNIFSSLSLERLLLKHTWIYSQCTFEGEMQTVVRLQNSDNFLSKFLT